MTSALVPFRYERRLRLPAPHGECLTYFPTSMLDIFPEFKDYKYNKHLCNVTKYTPQQILIPVNSLDPDGNLTNIICNSECDESLFTDAQSLFYPPHGMTEMNHSHVSFSIYSKDLTTTTMQQIPSMTFVDLLGMIGGLLGLWLGASMLSLLEFFELLTNLSLLSCSLVKSQWRKKRGKDAEQQ